MASMVRYILLMLCLLAWEASCDYSCLCSYQVELEIFEKPDPSSNVDGYMYEFDCKPSYPVDGLDQAYRAIGNEGKLGYVQMTSNIQIQTCQGSVPDIDRVKPATTLPASTTTTTTMRPSTTTTTVQPSTTTLSTTTMRPSTSTALLSTKTTTMPPTAKTNTTQATTVKLSTDTTQHLTTQQLTTQRLTTQRLTTQRLTTQRLTTQRLTTQHLTTKRLTTQHLTKTTARPTTSTQVTSPTVPTSTTTFTTAPPSTAKPLTNSCPMTVMQKAKSQNLFQHGSICYEFVPSNNSWSGAQNDCSLKGGHLVSIANQDQQNAVSNILQTLHVTSPVWLGLHDRVNEEHWQWDTGVPVTYTNWHPGRYIDQYHDQEDCGLMVPVQKHRWDDVDCNGITFAGLFQYAWICQYN